MPELPEVETVCRGLARAMTGKRLTRIEARRKDLRFPLPKGLKGKIEGQRIKRITRRAKYILMALENGTTLLLHLGMSGRLTLDDGREKPGKHDHVLFWLGPHLRLRFNDPRRFGMLDITATSSLTRHRLLRALGPEPLEKEFTATFLHERLKGKKQAIKLALMDQRLVVGVGNIYACEALFYSGIDPRRPAGHISLEECARLVKAVHVVLRASIKAGGSSLRDYVQSNGELGHFQKRFAVYGQEGEACKGCTCRATKTGGIQRITQGGRSTFYCPHRQT